MASLPRPITSAYLLRKKPEELKLRDISQNMWSAPFETVKVTQNEKSLRKCHSQEKPKFTWQLNIMWYSGDPSTDKNDIRLKTKKIWIKYRL